MWDPAYSQRNWALAAGYPEEMEAPSVALTLVNNLFAFNADPMDGGPTGIYLGPGVTLVNEGHNHLRPGSPGLDARGARLAPAHGLEGRIRDGQPDVGAYEGAAEAPAGPPEP